MDRHICGLAPVVHSYHHKSEGFLCGRNFVIYIIKMGTAVAQWLRCCATNQKVAGSIPDGVIGNFH